MHYDIAIIGGGPGGYTAAEKAAKAGLQVVLFEQEDLGGTCLNRGCMPTKALLHSAETFAALAHAQDLGVHTQGASYDFAAMHQRKAQVVETLRQGVEKLMKANKITVVHGQACIQKAGVVTCNEETYEVRDILIATGSKVAYPPIPGIDLPGVYNSRDMLQGNGQDFFSLVIIGGGVVGVEFASIYRCLGCQVTLLEAADHILPFMDREIAQRLTMILKKQGVEVLTSAMVRRVEQTPEGLTVHVDQKGREKAVSGEKVLCAIGRRPCWDGLFAPELVPETRGRSLLVDEDFRTSIPGVYAIGDVSAVIQLAHVAAAQGIACVNRMCGRQSATDLNVVPSCIYSSPEIAVVGLTEAEAKEQGISAVSGKCTMFGNARTVIEDPGRCFMKLVAERDTGRLIGAQLMCQHASDIISQLSAALVNGLTVGQLLSVMRPHPSFEEAMTEALERLAEKL